MIDNRYSHLPMNPGFNFVSFIEDLFHVKDLSRLHELSEIKYTEQFQIGKDSSTIFHKIFYDKYRAGWPELHDMYDRYIGKLIQFPEQVLYQKFPTFRVHLPGNVAVGAFHNDSEFGHPKGEINFIIPLTNSYDTASVWVESEPGKKDFIPMEMNVGEIIFFNGNYLTHGNKINETGKTRVSMDFRVLYLKDYDEHNNGQSITLNTKFKDGEYYKRYTV